MAVVLSAASIAQQNRSSAPHFADADDPREVAAGKTVYLRACASCHGRQLQGQPLWQVEDDYSGRRAPAHDESGHTWQHSDEELFQKTASGLFAFQAPQKTSAMPAFNQTLSDSQMLQAIAFIKSRWPLGLRVSQAMLNPGFAGMPADAEKVEWTLPPNCRSTTARWRSESR